MLTNPKCLFPPPLTSLPNVRLLDTTVYWTSPLECSSRHFKLIMSKTGSLTSHPHHLTAPPSPRALSMLVSGNSVLPLAQAKTLGVIPSSLPFQNPTSSPSGNARSSTLKIRPGSDHLFQVPLLSLEQTSQLHLRDSSGLITGPPCLPCLGSGHRQITAASTPAIPQHCVLVRGKPKVLKKPTGLASSVPCLSHSGLLPVDQMCRHAPT